MERKLFRRRDILILAVLLAASVFFFLITSRDKGDVAEIWVGGEMMYSYPLGTPFSTILDNGVEIKGDGSSAAFVHSDCPDKVCVNTGDLSVSGEWAACLPNETVLKITKGNDGVDTVS